MTKKPNSKIDICRKYSQKMPDVPDRQLARVIYEKHGHLWPTLDACYQTVRVAHGKHGDAQRKKCAEKHMFKEIQTGPFKWKMPESKSKVWSPFVAEAERTLIISDLHIPFHSVPAIETALSAADGWLRDERDAILINGDLGDFFSISRFEKNPSKSKLKDELEAMRAFLGYLRMRYPKVRIIYKFGNHDEWWEKHICRKSPELLGIPSVDLRRVLVADLSNSIIDSDDDEEAEKIGEEFSRPIDGIEFVVNQRIIMLGALPVMHGHEMGKGFAPPVNAARGAFMKALSHILVGHHHQWSSHQAKTILDKVIVTYSTGCLCSLHPEYARVNQWAHGFAKVEVYKGHEFSVANYRIINDRIYQ